MSATWASALASTWGYDKVCEASERARLMMEADRLDLVTDDELAAFGLTELAWRGALTRHPEQFTSGT